MRDAFAAEISELGAEDSRTVILSGDIGNRLFDKFKAKFPTRFYNCGIAEANMISMAAGMALSGLKPIAYTINSFITARCYEQIRLDLCYHNVPVILVGVGAGLGYASLGATHHSCEDIAMMRVLPNMTVICPGDAVEVRLAMRAALKLSGPVYIRLGKKGEPVVHKQPPPFTIGKGIVVREGKQVCLLSTGNVLPLVLETAEALSAKKISVQVVSMHTVKPLDEALLAKTFSNFDLVATVEEHSILGGFGGSVAEWLTDHLPQKAKFHRFGTSDSFLHEAGEQDYARERFGLTVEKISETIMTKLGSTR